MKIRKPEIPSLDQDFVAGSVKTPIGPVPGVSSVLRMKDRLGSIKARWGIGRMEYAIEPGLYALGAPDAASPVFVSANYKMSFDRLREVLPGLSAWILVLDTKGINVWCAAGKGTFGTDEVVNRIESSGVKNVVSHRELILPQLGAPGVSAHLVRKRSGFKVHYGPVLAKDIPLYLSAGLKASPEMRVKAFTVKERTVLIPIELVATIKPFLLIAPVLLVISGIGGPSGFWANMLNHGLFAVAAFLCAILGGTVLNPVLLPWVPGRAFAVKGFLIGLCLAAALLILRGHSLETWPGRFEAAAWFMIVPAVAGHLAMNFTGCSTYTSLSGVKKEMHWALPVQIGGAAVGLVLWIASLLVS